MQTKRIDNMRNNLILFIKPIIAILALLLLPLPGTVCPSFASQKVTLTIGDTFDRSSNGYDGENQLRFWKLLEEKLDVEIRFVQLNEDSYSAAMASGDLPDIVATNNNLAEIMDTHLAMNLDPYLEEYVPNFLKGASRPAYDLFKKLINGGEGFYFFPCGIGYNGIGYYNTFYTRGYSLRWDYYKELGYPEINNEDDFLEVLKKMHENHPFTEEGYPTYLYGVDNLSGYDTAFRADLSLDYWAAFQYQNNIFTNEIYDGYVDTDHSKWWAAAAWQNKLYRAGREDGSYDLEMLTQTEDEFVAKCERGQYLGVDYAKSGFYNKKAGDDPDTLSGYCTVPTAAANYYNNVYQIVGNGSAYMWFISERSPHKEQALRLFNYMCDPDFLRERAMGEKGVTWDYNDSGVPEMTAYGKKEMDAYNSGTASDDNYYNNWSNFAGLPNNWPLLRMNTLHPDGYPLDFYTQSREYVVSTMNNNISKDICSHYNVELPSDAFYKKGGLDFRNDCGEAISSCMSSLKTDQLRILKEAAALMDSVQVDLILADSDEEFKRLQKKTTEQIKDLGEEAVFLDYRKKWNAVAKVIVPLVREVQIANGIKPYTKEDYEKLPYKK